MIRPSRIAHAAINFATIVLAASAVLALSTGCKKKSATDALDASLDAALASGDSAGDGGDAVDASADAGIDSGIAPPPPITAAPSAFSEGQTWTGSYSCSTGESQLTLIVHTGAPKVNLVFSFKKGLVVGQFKMSGVYDATKRHIHLTGGEWINKPGQYNTVDLDGKVSADGHTFSGTVISPGCSGFSVHR